MSWTSLVRIAVILASTVASAPAAAAFSPLDQPGPALSVAPAVLAEGLHCSGDLHGVQIDPVLLVPATGVTPTENYSWNWQRALASLGRPSCTITLPNYTLADLQLSAQYIVYAIRKMHAESQRQVDVLGHSQGGNLPRWALRFWPDLRPMVDDQLGWAPANHGTDSPAVRAQCRNGCPTALRQQLSDTEYVRASNSFAETFAGISYTDIYTHQDELVDPAQDDSGTSSLHSGTGNIANIAVQDVCPADIVDHLGVGTFDPVAYALTIDALTHAGPADVQRVPGTTCAAGLMPGVDRLSFASDVAGAGSALAQHLRDARTARDAPPLTCNVTETCRPVTSRLSVTHVRLRRGILRLRGTTRPQVARLRVSFRTRGRATVFVIKPVRGRIRFVGRLGGRQQSATSGLVTIIPLLTANPAADTVRLRVAQRLARLSVRRATITPDGELQATGMIDRRAGGALRARIDFRDVGGRLRSIQANALIAYRRWDLSVDLGPAGPRMADLALRILGRRRHVQPPLSGVRIAVHVR